MGRKSIISAVIVNNVLSDILKTKKKLFSEKEELEFDKKIKGCFSLEIFVDISVEIPQNNKDAHKLLMDYFADKNLTFELDDAEILKAYQFIELMDQKERKLICYNGITAFGKDKTLITDIKDYKIYGYGDTKARFALYSRDLEAIEIIKLFDFSKYDINLVLENDLILTYGINKEWKINYDSLKEFCSELESFLSKNREKGILFIMQYQTPPEFLCWKFYLGEKMHNFFGYCPAYAPDIEKYYNKYPLEDLLVSLKRINQYGYSGYWLTDLEREYIKDKFDLSIKRSMYAN